MIALIALCSGTLLGCGESQLTHQDQATGEEADAGQTDAGVEIGPGPVFDCVRDNAPCSILETTEEGRQRQAELHALAHQRLFEQGQTPSEVAAWLGTHHDVVRAAASSHGLKFQVEESVPTHILTSAEEDEETATRDNFLSHSPDEEKQNTFAPQTRRQESHRDDYNVIGDDASELDVLYYDPLNSYWNHPLEATNIQGKINRWKRPVTYTHLQGERADWDALTTLADYDVIFIVTHGGDKKVLYVNGHQGSVPQGSETFIAYGLQTGTHLSVTSSRTQQRVNDCLETLYREAENGRVPLIDTNWPGLQTPITVVPFACGQGPAHKLPPTRGGTKWPVSYWANYALFEEYVDTLEDTLVFMAVCSSLAEYDEATGVAHGSAVSASRLAHQLVGGVEHGSVLFGWTGTGLINEDWILAVLNAMGSRHVTEAYRYRCDKPDEEDGTRCKIKWMDDGELVETAYWKYYPDPGPILYADDPEEEDEPWWSCISPFSTDSTNSCPAPEPNQWVLVEVVGDPDVEGSGDPPGFEIERLYVRNVDTGAVIEPVEIVDPIDANAELEAAAEKIQSDESQPDAFECQPSNYSSSQPYGQWPEWDDTTIRFGTGVLVRLAEPIPAEGRHRLFVERPAGSHSDGGTQTVCSASGYAKIALGDRHSFPHKASPEGADGFGQIGRIFSAPIVKPSADEARAGCDDGSIAADALCRVAD